MKRIVLLLLLLLPIVAAAQIVPDNEDILKRTIDSSSPYYYPSLMLRYQSGDKTLSLKDYHYLYYGYAYRPEYKPLDTIEAEDRVLMVLERGDLQKHDAEELLHYAWEVMSHDPFSPKNLNFMTYAYGILGDSINEAISADRFEKIIATIEGSGSGIKENQPMHVLRFSHAADVLNARGLAIKDRKVVALDTEFIYLTEKDKNGQRGYYFDFGRMYWNRPDEAPKKEQRWQFNNLPVKR